MKRIIFLSIILVLFFVILHLVTSIYTLWHKQDVLTNANEQLVQERQENSALQKQLAKVKSPQFLDQEARNKLLLVKPGEAEVLIDPSLLQASGEAEKKQGNEPFWQQWVHLFF